MLDADAVMSGEVHRGMGLIGCPMRARCPNDLVGKIVPCR